ncbi:cyclase family protein, partial [Streptomyces sp. SID5770]|nr:cyclase family protein [Streptomyces sp. SID5770]
AVALLAERGAVLVATDSVERDGPAAKALAEAGLPALTGLTGLTGLPATDTRLHAVPHPADHGDGTGVRAYGVTG